MSLSAKHNFVFRAFESDGNQPFHSPPDNIHAARYGGFQRVRSATLGHTCVMNSNTVVHTQFTGAHQLANIATDFPLTTADLGVDLDADGQSHRYQHDATAAYRLTRRCTRSVSAAAASNCCMTGTSRKGNHTLVWGMSIVRKRFNNNTLFHSSGQFQFDGHATGFGNHERFRSRRFLLGGFSFFTQNSGEFEQRRGTQTGWYFGDTWRVRPRLDAELRHPL